MANSAQSSSEPDRFERHKNTMMNHLNRRPRKGDRIGFGEFVDGEYPKVTPPTKAEYTVTATPEDGTNLAYIRKDGAEQAHPFIFWFEVDQRFNYLAHVETEST